MTQTMSVRLAWEGKKSPSGQGSPAEPRRAWNAAGSFPGLPAPTGAPGWLLQGDNLDTLRWLEGSQAGTVALAYLDPPFFTNREHAAWLRKAGAPPGSERRRVPAFDDRWEDISAWLDAMGGRLDAVRNLLAPHGSVIVHVDPKTSHYVKVLGDEIFGPEAFASEIVWRYRRWPSKTPNFQRVHDVLLRWRKDPGASARFTQLYEPLAASTLATWGKNKQRAVFARDGRRSRSSSTSEPTQGVPMGDVWDIGVIAPIARERTGYPSQKPEALLERLLTALTHEGDLVLDPYGGSGTTLAVAHRLGRAFIGIDSSPVALDVARARLGALLPGGEMVEVSPSALRGPRTSEHPSPAPARENMAVGASLRAPPRRRFNRVSGGSGQ
ncbi:MAG: DNA-methyltransferase [Polyangiaceae bacterium]